MSRAGRVVVVGLAVGLGLAADSTGGVKARRCKRDFPTFSKCPVHTGEVASSDSLVFTAQRSNATLTFLACDDRFGAPPDGSSSIDLSIDDLIVVDRAFFNANLIPYPGDRPEDLEAYRVDRSTDACYNNNPPVAEVFRREAATAPSATMPLYERFEGSSRGWTLVNATFGLEDLDPPDDTNNPALNSRSRSLILARSQRDGQPGNLCSMASVRLSRLVRNREYVIDFTWFAAGFVDDGQDTGQYILTVAVDDESPVPSGPATRSLPLGGRSPVLSTLPSRSPTR